MTPVFNLEVNVERNQQVIRILNILHKMLYSRIGFTIANLADEFGVSEKTIRRDIMAIRDSRFNLANHNTEFGTRYTVTEKLPR